MWKLVSALRVLSERSRSHASHAFSIGRRFMLSEAFQCRSAWEKRFQTPVLQNVNIDELYNEIEKKFNRDGKASVIDIDLFANAVRKETYADELEDIIHKLRLSSNTSKTMTSTPHALIRYFADIEDYESLLRILNDRLNYGIFPDAYCMCLLLDTFIKQKKITEAARLSSIHMLQEDWSNPLVSTLALYACHLYVQNPDPWKDELAEEDDGEEIKVRVLFIRNPYFDDHFDLRDPQLLVGKTLAAIGVTMPDTVGQTYRLVGLGLHRKWEKAISFLQQLSNTGIKPGLFKAGVKIFEETCERDLNDENDPEAKLRGKFKSFFNELDNQGLITNDDLHAAVISKVEEVVSKEEQNLINTQQTLYEEWENLRDKMLKEELEEIRRQQRLAAIEQEKQYLIQKEQELFFFDNEEKLDLFLEQKELEQKETDSKVVKKKHKGESTEYIPPEVRSSVNR